MDWVAVVAAAAAFACVFAGRCRVGDGGGDDGD